MEGKGTQADGRNVPITALIAQEKTFSHTSFNCNKLMAGGKKAGRHYQICCGRVMMNFLAQQHEHSHHDPAAVLFIVLCNHICESCNEVIL